jgi:SAM-dependent methyltransferase
MAKSDAARRWADELGRWGIPQEIIDQAPESPWVHPPAMFVVDDAEHEHIDSVSDRWARAALGEAGTVLDVGCGGGRSSVPLAPNATYITGVDENERMLVNFADACAQASIAHREVVGNWPDVAGRVDAADVVVCHHVVYNVSDLEPFVQALTDHSRRLVVVELPMHHPTSSFNPVWRRFWNLERPDGPTADDFVDVVRSMDLDPSSEVTVRPARKPGLKRDDYVAFVRRRLCLTAERDREIERAIDELDPAPEQIVTVAWAPPTQ